MWAFAVNGLTVVAGSIIGLIFRKFIKKETCDSVLKAMGIVVLLIGLIGVIENMVTVTDGKKVCKELISYMIDNKFIIKQNNKYSLLK